MADRAIAFSNFLKKGLENLEAVSADLSRKDQQNDECFSMYVSGKKEAYEEILSEFHKIFETSKVIRKAELKRAVVTEAEILEFKLQDKIKKV
jgi:hypothetical protein